MRCEWAEKHELLKKYHDHEWGNPIYDDNLLFEYLLLETAQAGLSWLTILKRRNGYREAYDNFNYHKISKYSDKKIKSLMENKSIIRNKLKIKSSVNNALQFIKIQQEYKTFSNYIWNFTNTKIIYTNSNITQEISDLTSKITKDMKKRGFKFIGETIILSYLQAIGVINSHSSNCFKNKFNI